MSRFVSALLALAVAGLVAAGTAVAAPFGFTDPVRVGGARVAIDVAAVGPGGTGVVAWLDRTGEIHAVRIASTGVVGADRTLAKGQGTARGLHAVVTDRGEIVLVWSSFSRERNAVMQIAASAKGTWGNLHTLGLVGSYTAAMPQIAALGGGTVAAIWRDRQAPKGADTLRYARRAPGRPFGAARSLGHDGVFPYLAATTAGGALLSWQRGPVNRRVAVVAPARPGDPLPGVAQDVAGNVRSAAPLFASADGTVVLSWMRKDDARTTWRTRSVAPSVGPVRALAAQVVPYTTPQLAISAGRTSGRTSIAAWADQQPSVGSHVLAATATNLGPWGTPVPLHAKGTGFDGQPQPVILATGTVLVAWAKSRDEIGSAMYDAAIGQVGAPAPAEPQTLGATAGPVGVRLVRGDRRVIAAWPDPVVGVRIATRPG